ncbi:MAG: PBP1A family penicillin-binding protein [Flavobacteriales bacterium TMED235]|nr:MAG: PBP1A family penicillin-binding protein [Flavobacteriales bacterium TMED235]
MSKFIKNLLIAFTLFLLVCIIVVFSTLWSYSNKLPDYKFLKNYKPPVSSKVYSGDGVLISDFSSEKRIFVPFNAIPKKIIHSFLSSEDKNFFRHPGVDAKGVLRAIKNNFFNLINSNRLEGASTITQQVAKNFLLSNEVSLDRKLKEAILAFRIERALSKERILELYLNQIYLGEGSYGIASASLRYFDKPIRELNYSESALLAALPKAPSKYNPYKNKELATYRRNLVIKNLYENNYISKEKYDELINSEIILKKRKRIFLEDTRYFVEDIRKKVIQDYGYDKVHKQGFNIKSPINLELQNLASASLRKGLLEYDKRKGWRGPLDNRKVKDWNKNLEKFNLEKTIGWDIAIVKRIDRFETVVQTSNKENGIIRYEDINWTRKNFEQIFKINDLIYVKKISDGIFSLRQLPNVNGGIVVMDPYSGRVLAMSGGFSFKKSEFNRVSQANRQPGSAFKPFIYALALENNYTPSSLILDAPIVLDQGDDLKMWKPENYGKKFYGLSTLRTGVEKSRNLMTVRISQDLGIDKIINFSKKLNIYKNPDELLSVSLGSVETTLLNITSAYCSFVNGGKLVTPILIDRIQESEGNTIFNNEKRFCENCDRISFEGNSKPIIKSNFKQIFSPQTAYQMTSILEGVIQRGTGKKLRDLNLQLAGKTGTTNNNTDTWFIGFTSNLVVGVYVGYDNPRKLGKYETGSKTALPIFKDFIKKAVNNYEARPFKIAKGIKMMVIDAETGKKADFNSKKTIIESYKKEKIENLQLISNDRSYSSILKKNILKFY